MRAQGGRIDRAAIVACARRWIGTPYRHGTALQGVGCDCLGLVLGVWRTLYGDLPEPVPAYPADWAEAGRNETLAAAAARHCARVPVADVRPGDLLLMRWREHLPAQHCGFATGAGRMVHAHAGAGVAEVALGAWSRRVVFAFALPGLEEEP